MIHLSNLEAHEDRAGRAVNEIVFTLDLAGYFKSVNVEGQRLIGYSSEEVRHMNVSEIVAPEFAGVVRQQISRTIQRRVGAVYQIEIITKDRRRVRLETSIHLVVRDGRPIEIHGIALPPVANLREMRVRCLDANFAFGTLSRVG